MSPNFSQRYDCSISTSFSSKLRYYYYYYCCCRPPPPPCCHLYAWYLQLYTWIQQYFKCIYSCSCSVFTICATCIVISPVKYVMYFYISTFCSMCVQCPVWLFFVVVLSWYVAQVLSDFEMVPVAPIITGITYHICFPIPQTLNFYYEVFIF